MLMYKDSNIDFPPFSALDLITTKEPEPGWDLFILPQQLIMLAAFTNCIFCWEKREDEFGEYAGELSRGSLQLIKAE